MKKSLSIMLSIIMIISTLVLVPVNSFAKGFDTAVDIKVGDRFEATNGQYLQSNYRFTPEKQELIELNFLQVLMMKVIIM